MFSQVVTGGISGLLEGANKLIDTFYTSDEEKQKWKMELLNHQLDVFKAQQAEALAQMEINKAEAGHASIFVAGWRPFVGWVCGSALAYALILRSFLVWITNIVATFAEVTIPVPPEVNTEILMTTLMGMLGMAGYRTYERMKGVARKGIK